MLSCSDIKFAMSCGRFSISPKPYIGPVSIDLTLSNEFHTIVSDEVIDLYPEKPLDTQSLLKRINAEEDLFLFPGQFVLGLTNETVSLDNSLVGIIDGKSSLARLGLSVHLTAHTVCPGWTGKIVLEIKNDGPLALRLRPGMPICALSLTEVDTPVTTEKSRYHGQDKVQMPVLKR